MNYIKKLGTMGRSSADQRDHALGLTHLRKLFAEFRHPTRKATQEEQEYKLYNMIPLFVKVPCLCLQDVNCYPLFFFFFFTPSLSHRVKFKVTGRKSLVYIFLMEKHWTFLLHIKIDYDLLVWHELDPGSLRRLKVTGRKSGIIVSVLHLSYGENLDVPSSHKDCL